MNTHILFRGLLAIAILGLLTLYINPPQQTRAQTGAGYDLSWNVLGGHPPSAGGGYELRGVIGQPGVMRLSGQAHTLSSGFFGGSAAAPPHYRHVYLPPVLRTR